MDVPYELFHLLLFFFLLLLLMMLVEKLAQLLFSVLLLNLHLEDIG